MELIQRVMIHAAKSYGSDDGMFNGANFSCSMIELSGVKQTLDGKMVRAILEGRSDVEHLPGGSYYRFKGVAPRTEEARQKGVLIVCVDFDGVLHGYQSGWKGACEIPDPPVPGALDWLYSMSLDSRFEMAVYSSRSKEPGAIQAIQTWLVKHYKERFSVHSPADVNQSLEEADLAVEKLAQKVVGRLKFPTQKPAASMMIDDRAFCFEGTFPTAKWILDFKPWNKK